MDRSKMDDQERASYDVMGAIIDAAGEAMAEVHPNPPRMPKWEEMTDEYQAMMGNTLHPLLATLASLIQTAPLRDGVSKT